MKPFWPLALPWQPPALQPAFVPIFTEQLEKGNYKEQEQELNRRRQAAVREVHAVGGAAAVIAFARAVEEARYVGFAFGGVADDTDDAVVLPALLGAADSPATNFTAAYVWGRWTVAGWGWVDRFNFSRWKPDT